MRVRRRWPPTGALVFALAACAGGGAVQPTANARPPSASSGPVCGTVRDAHGRPLPDQIVAIGAAKGTSDGDGRFSFPRVPGRYDLVIASPDGTQATVYRDLTRRDPLIVFDGAASGAPKHRAEIAVTLVGVDPGLPDWQVHFVSARAFAQVRGANPRPLAVSWDGADSISGVVMAHAMKVKMYEIPATQFARQAVTLRDGQNLDVELHVEKAPVAHRPEPRVEVPKEDPGFDPIYIEEYRLPGAGFAMKGPGGVSGPYEIPDLTGFGLQLCGEGRQWNPYLHSRRIKCGGAPGERIVLVLPGPPAFKSPAWDTVATPGMQFEWARVTGAVYRLEIGNGSYGNPTAKLPRIQIVTARTTAAWPDLHAVGIEFPRPLAAYAAVIEAHGPFATVDDLVGPNGLGDPTPRDRWSAESKQLSIPVRPPLGKEEAACKFKETVICGGAGDQESPIGELYRLSAINRTIQTYPDFAVEAKIHCVRDCAGARAYLKAYAVYRTMHPGFDSDQPLPVPGPDEPTPPPEMFQGKRRPYSGKD